MLKLKSGTHQKTPTQNMKGGKDNTDTDKTDKSVFRCIPLIRLDVLYIFLYRFEILLFQESFQSNIYKYQ